MSNRKNIFTYQGQTFCETLYKDGQKKRSRLFLVVPEKGRYLQRGMWTARQIPRIRRFPPVIW